MEDLESLWRRYHAANRADDGLRNELYSRYEWVACRVANALGRNSRAAEREDIHAEARLALLRAIGDWKPELGGDFEQYAGFMIRARIVDSLRANHWVGKSTRQTAKRLAQGEEELLVSNRGRRATEEELAAHLGLGVDELAQMRSRVARTPWEITSLDQAPPGADLGNWHETIADDSQSGPEAEMIAAERQRQLAGVLDRLSPVHREILVRRFLNGEPSTEIAKSLNLHESRISQLCQSALTEARELAHRRVLQL